jgi:RpiB/LacA/LacB family sugar-phosphate isomerase
MRISIGADDQGPLARFVLHELVSLGHELIVHGDLTGTHEEYVDVAEAVARDIAEGRADEGVLMCWTGTGVSIAANKVPGVRAALCGDAETARGARRWNHANVLALSMRTVSEPLGREIVSAWLEEPFGETSVDTENVAKLRKLDQCKLAATP